MVLKFYVVKTLVYLKIEEEYSLLPQEKINYEFPVGSKKSTSVNSILEPIKISKKYIISKKLWTGHVQRKEEIKKEG